MRNVSVRFMIWTDLLSETRWKTSLEYDLVKDYEVVMGHEYNNLTKKLLAEGYTVDNYPDYVQICTSRLPGNDPLNNLSGGFEYKRLYRDEFIYKTGCGMHVKGSNVLEMGMGVDWSHENDNPVIRCPYDKSHCERNDPRLYGERGGGLCIQCWCVCHRTDELYDYNKSIEKADKEREEEKERKYQEYSKSHNGRVCRNHMYYDERKREWNLHYIPKRCAYICYSQNGYCPILGRQLSKKRGNVYYDLKKSYIRHDGTLFDGQEVVFIEKGIRFFKKPVSMDICESFIKVQKDDILHDYEINNSWERFWNKDIKIEILNIRAESKPSRDLMQDLEDIKAGIAIAYSEDYEKQAKEMKKEKKKVAQQKRIEKLEKKILEVGYWNMDPYSLDRVHADKWLGALRIDELEEMRQQKLKEEQEKPVQLSLFDMM